MRTTKAVFRLYFCFSLMVLSVCFMACASKMDAVPAATHPVIAVTAVDDFQWPDQELADRFAKYWSLRRAGDSGTLFQMEAPHVQEMVIRGRYNAFYSNVKKEWLSIRVEKIRKVSDQLIEIDFKMLTKKSNESAREVFYRDSWLLLSDNWLHVAKDPFLTGEGFGKRN